MKNYLPAMYALALIFIFGVSPLKSQNALDLDGTSDYVQTTSPSILGANARTVEAWIKTSANANPSVGGVQQIIADMGNFTTGGRFTFCVLWSNAIRLEVGGSGLSGTIAVNDTLWHHVAGVYDPTATDRFALYVDGVLDVSGNISTTVNTGTGNIRIGERVDGANNFDGSIDEVRVWNFAKTQTQLQADMNNELCGGTGLVAYYKFNEGIAGGANTGVTTLPDLSGNGYNGTLQNFALSGTSSNWVAGVTLTPGVGTTGMISPSACSSYLSPSGKFTWTATNTYMDTIPNTAGCDSVITVNLTISGATTDSIAPTVCDSYISPSGKFLTTTGMYLDTIPNLSGCDSILTIDLTVNTTTFGTIAPTACDSYTSPSGNFTWTASGTYQDVIPNRNGCDSLIGITLTIAGNSTSTISEMACDFYTSPSGNHVWTTTGVYFDTLSNNAGCDSTMIINLIVNSSTTNTLTETACRTYTSPSGKYTWTASGVYQDTVTNANGCEEFLTINLTIQTVDVSLTPDFGFVTANATGVNYQWLDCNNNFAVLAGETNREFYTTGFDSVAVEITDNGCIDTSRCVSVYGFDAIFDPFETPILLYPNPTSGHFRVDLGKSYPEVSIQVHDLQGRLVYGIEMPEAKLTEIDLTGNPQGMYRVTVMSGEMRGVFQLSVR